MGRLDVLVGRATVRGSRYLPFSEPRFHWDSRLFNSWQRRVPVVNSSALALLPAMSARKYPSAALPVALKDYEDRRLWSPYPVKPAVGIGKTYYRVVDFTPLPIAPRWDFPRRKPGSPDVMPDIPGRQFPVKMPNFPIPRGFDHYKGEAMWKRGKHFDAPWKMVICLKRKIRREVMNALGLAGRVGQKKPTFNTYSKVRC